MAHFLKRACWAAAISLAGTAWGQTQISVTLPAADAVLKGNYNPATYKATTVIDQISVIAPDMAARVSPDSLKSYLTKLVSFQNRNSASDTVSAVRGVGAARRWIHAKFSEFSAQSGGRLLVSYLQFTQNMCGVMSHRNVMAVLPGRDTANHAIVLVEGHFDSMCEDNCNVTCVANGAEDNGSGTVLVMEAARVLSKYTFNHTVVFMANTGEEQGTHGAAALASYCAQQKIPVKAVLNNDISGGILCGPTSSPPSCTPGALDSARVRIFSTAINFSLNKALARFVKGQYDQWIKPTADIPMTISILDPTDRTGRGGDHQPFSEAGFAAIRLISAHENGNGSPTGGRQHTSKDILGEDTDNNGSIDKYFVNFDYLARNTRINAIGLIVAALGPQVPDFTLSEPPPLRHIKVAIAAPVSPAGIYKVAVRTAGSNDFSTVHTLRDSLVFYIPGTKAGTTYYVAVASVDANGAQSLYSQEKSITSAADGPPVSLRGAGPPPGSPRLSEPKVLADGIAFAVEAGRPGRPLAATLEILDAGGRSLLRHEFLWTGAAYEAALARRALGPGAYEAVLRSADRILARKSFSLRAN